MTEVNKSRFCCYLQNLERYVNEICLPGLDFRSKPIPIESIFVEPDVVLEESRDSRKPILTLGDCKRFCTNLRWCNGHKRL
jgi:hypothetical protein